MKKIFSISVFVSLITFISISSFAQADQHKLDELNKKAFKAWDSRNYADAIKYYLQSLQIDSTGEYVKERIIMSYELLGEKERDKKNYFKEIEYYRKAIAIDTASEYNYIKVHLQEAIGAHIPPLLDEAGSLVKNKKYKEATDLYNKILQADPSNQIALQALNDMSLAQTDADGAITLLNEKIKSDPTNNLAYFNLEKILRQKKDTAALFRLLHVMAKNLKGNDQIHAYDGFIDFYTNWVKDEHAADSWYNTKLNSFSDKRKMEEYERKNRERGINTNVDSIIAIYRRLWNTRDNQYLPTGINYAYTFLLNPYNKSASSGADIRKAETILDHDINVNYKEIIRDKDIIYPQSDYKYGNRGEKEEKQKAFVCQMLEAKAAIQFLAGDIQQAKQTLDKEYEILLLRSNKTSKERELYFINMSILYDRLNDVVTANKYYDEWKAYVPDHFDRKGNLCIRFMHGSDEYYFQMKIIGDKDMIVKDYHYAKQNDEEAAAKAEEYMRQKIREEDEAKFSGKRKYMFIIRRDIYSYVYADAQYEGNEIQPYTIYSDVSLIKPEVFDKINNVWGNFEDDMSDYDIKFYDCEKEDCASLINSVVKEHPDSKLRKTITFFWK